MQPNWALHWQPGDTRFTLFRMHCRSRLGKLTPNIFFHEVPVSNYPLFEYPPYALTLTSKMADIAKHEKLDLLHVHYAIPHATSAVLARQILQQQGIRIPVVTTLHGTDITLVGRDPSFEPVVTYSMNQSDGITAVSDYLRQETINHFQITNEIEVIPNFIDTERFQRLQTASLKQELCPNCEKVLVSCIKLSTGEKRASRSRDLPQAARSRPLPETALCRRRAGPDAGGTPCKKTRRL